MKGLYSVAICPPDEVVEQIRHYKNLLAEKIKWYNSRNAAAHITFNVFMCEENELIKWENFVASFCKEVSQFQLTFTKTDFFTNGAFFLSPDQDSRETLIELMKSFHSSAVLKPDATSIEPQISIARKLTSEKIEIATQLFAEQNIFVSFRSEGLAIRKFNEVTKQYQIYKRFSFGSAQQKLGF
jgi:hypothetical protein